MSFLKTLPDSDFILTGAKDGSINIWNTRIRLHATGSYNFKSKLYEPEDLHHLSIDQVTKQLLKGTAIEERKKGDGEVKLILKKNNKAQKGEEITEDILFTMFDEQQDVEGSEASVDSDDEDHITHYLIDYTDQPGAVITGDKVQPPKKDQEEEKVLPSPKEE